MVELVLLLPFFVIFAFVCCSFMEIMYRAVGISHASFSAARRTAVVEMGFAPEIVRRHYEGLSMRGYPDVKAPVSGRNPKIRAVSVADNYSVRWLTRGSSRVYPGLEERWLRIPHAPVRVAGTGPRSLGSDNEL